MPAPTLVFAGVALPGVTHLRPHDEAWLTAVVRADARAARRAWLAPVAEKVVEAGLDHLMDHGPQGLLEEILPRLPASLDWGRVVIKALDSDHAEVLPFGLPRVALLDDPRLLQHALARGDRPVARRTLEAFVAQASGTDLLSKEDWGELSWSTRLMGALRWAVQVRRDAAVTALLALDTDGQLTDHAFIHAARQDHRALVAQLLPSRSWRTCQAALTPAVEEGQQAMVETLLPHAQLAAHPLNLLESAVHYDQADMIPVLAPHVDPHHNHCSALGLAIERQNAAVLRALLVHIDPAQVPTGKLHLAMRQSCDLVLDWAWPAIAEPETRLRLLLTAAGDGLYDQVVKRIAPSEWEALGRRVLDKKTWPVLNELGLRAPVEQALAWFQRVPSEALAQVPHLHARQQAHERAQAAADIQIGPARARLRS